MTTLQIRLKHCLQTIMELKPAMRKLYQTNFEEDFCRLESYANQIREMRLNEEDVARLEGLTADFIRTIGFSGCRPVFPAGRLQ